MLGFHMVVSVVRFFLIRQKRQIRQIQLYGNQALGDIYYEDCDKVTSLKSYCFYTYYLIITR